MRKFKLFLTKYGRTLNEWTNEGEVFEDDIYKRYYFKKEKVNLREFIITVWSTCKESHHWQEVLFNVLAPREMIIQILYLLCDRNKRINELVVCCTVKSQVVL